MKRNMTDDYNRGPCQRPLGWHSVAVRQIREPLSQREGQQIGDAGDNGMAWAATCRSVQDVEVVRVLPNLSNRADVQYRYLSCGGVSRHSL